MITILLTSSLMVLMLQFCSLQCNEVQCIKRKQMLINCMICRLWAEIEAHKWRDLELNLSKTVEELRQDSQLIQANSKKKLRDNKKLLECSFAQI